MIDGILVDTLVTGLPLVPAVLGIFLVLRIREDFDLTVEGSFALGAAVTATGIVGGIPAWLAMLIGVAAGCLAGFVTALLNLLLHIPVLMGGLIMNMGLFTVTLHVLGLPTVSLLGADTIFTAVAPHPGRAADLGMSAVLAVIVVVVLALFALFLRTEVGLALRASGANARMVRSQGVNDKGLLALSLMISNGLGALSGGLLAQVQGFADVNMGVGVFLGGVGAVLLGSLLLSPTGSRVIRIVLAVLVGALVYRLILVAALRAGLPAGDLRGITALTLVVAVAAQGYLAPVLSRYRIPFARRASREDPPPSPDHGERVLEASHA
jgi:putative tryptophan/tyrosine transport system permease protein